METTTEKKKMTTTSVTENWNAKKSKELYGIDTWGHGYFDVNPKGNVVVCPRGENGPKGSVGTCQ